MPTAQVEERPQYWPFHSLERGAASSRELGLPSRGLVVLTLGDEAAFRSFWARAHRFRDTYASDDPVPPPPPRVDFSRVVAVVVIGRTASAAVHVQKMWTLPQEKLVAGVFNPFWPDVPMDPERVPYEIVLARRSTRRVELFERPAARALVGPTHLALAPLPLPEIRPSELGEAQMKQFREVLAKRGEEVLAALDSLPASREGDPEVPYAKMLRAAVLQRFLGKLEEAHHEWRGVVVNWPGTAVARLAKSRLLTLERRPMDDEARAVLDERRRVLSSGATIGPEHARQWSDLALNYTYLASQAPESLYVAARCYVEAARDRADDDRAQNGLLEAASLYEQYFDPTVALRLYWQCVQRWPDARSIPQVLKKMGRIGWDLRRPNALARYCTAFLHRFPKSRNAPAVRRLLARAQPATGRSSP